jgi:serine/threonine protein kinase
VSSERPTPSDAFETRQAARVVVKGGRDPMCGRVLAGRYRITSRIARGGMGSVYLARSTEDGAPYAVKVLREELLLDGRIRERFMYEARAAARIVHRSVVRTYEIGETPTGEMFIVMEYVNGPPLRRLIQAGPVEEPRAVELAIAIAEGLAAAHGKGIIHRDLKPENVLMPRDKAAGSPVKLADFGVARILDAPRITTTQHVLGTPHYVSPEQAVGGPIDDRCDLYSFGIILYEMLSGALPFSGDDPTSLLKKHVKSRPAPLCDVVRAGSVSPALGRLVMSCLEKSPFHRPESAERIVAALAALR